MHLICFEIKQIIQVTRENPIVFMQKKIDYILHCFKEVFAIDELPATLTYGTEGDAAIRVKQGDTASLIRHERYIPENHQIVWKSWKGVQVPFFFGTDEGDLVTRSGDHFLITQDILASAFYLLSGWHEHFSSDRDVFGRFPFSSSLPYRLNIAGIPVVNYYFDILKTIMEEASGKPLIYPTWEGKPYVLCLTHDIDTCESAWLEGSMYALCKGDILTPLLLLSKKILGKDGWFNFEEIIQVEQHFGASSTFFFLATSSPNLGIKNADYTLDRPSLRKIQQFISQSGSETGIHGSTGTSSDTGRLRSEIDSFTAPVCGNRFHFLLYQPDTTGKVLDDSGLAYDSSLGFAEMPGFRNSFCFPFHPWDIANEKPFKHTEIPLVLMDGTLRKYNNLKPSEAMGTVSPLLNEIRKFNGCMTVLWHNTHFSKYKYPGWKEVYVKIVESAANENAGLLSCRKLLDLYSQRNPISKK